MTVKFAVAGTGWVAGEYLQSIINHPQAELYGIMSPDQSRAEAALAAQGVEARIYQNYEKLVEDPNVDAVVLCSTPAARPERTTLAAQHGKHIVIEKPMAMNKEKLWEMAEALEKNPVKTAVSFVLRWNPMFDMAKKLIRKDVLGRIFMAQLDYWHHVGPQYGQYRWSSKKELGGSSILSAGCHAVDALRYFVGEVEEVVAYSGQTWADSEYGFDPNAAALMKMENGGIGTISSSLECSTPYKFNVRLLGEKGSLMNNQLYTKTIPGQTDYATIPTILPDSGDVSHHPFTDEIDEFIQAIQNDTKTRCDFDEGFKTMELCFAIDEAIATGRKVTLPLRA